MSIKPAHTNQRGFSLIELLIAMVVTLVVMTISVTLLARSLHIRTRENERSDEVADVQRAMNIMSREISNAGFNLNGNGIVANDSNATAIRVRANLNKFNSAFSTGAQNGIGVVDEDAGEDVTFFVNDAENTNYLARWDPLQPSGPGLPEMRKTVLANRIDGCRFYYFDQKVTYTQDPQNCRITNPTQAEVGDRTKAKFVVIVACVNTNEVGVPGEPGYQPPAQILLVSDVALRNSNLTKY
ncbi:MAG: hypothetical protein QOD75_49 [Blastocatellia bacterium]|jgi:prepilin-type N-terminal cleavage/methylation domain-containing protein|nr:hypothetical protein [Blastocatellia bacterium]